MATGMPPRRTVSRAAGTLVLLAVAAAAAVLASGSLVASSTTATPSGESPPRGSGGDLGEADGAVPSGTTFFDDRVPGVANLDPTLLRALRRAASDAADDGVELTLESGWRSSEYQQHLLDDAIAQYGSRTEAARWVATPEKSAHVSGDAVDVARGDATTWLSDHGARYGLCRIYGNEPWHFELRPRAVERGCPPPYADPTHDPRLRG